MNQKKIIFILLEVVLHPPIYSQTTAPNTQQRNNHPYTYQRKTESKVILPQDQSASTEKEKKTEFTLELPQDAKPTRLASNSDESDNDDSDGSDSDNG